MNMVARRGSLTVVLMISVLVTGVALLESWQRWPYAPFPLAHAALALLIPIWWRKLPPRGPRQSLRVHRRLTIGVGLAALSFIGGYIILYTLVLRATDRVSDPEWNLIAQYRHLFQLYADRYGWTLVIIAAYLLLGVWPMFGEELFYRGFVFERLRAYSSPLFAGAVSSGLFGLRHASQLVYLWPAYPLVAGVAYFIWAAGFAVLWAWAYHRSGSLWPCIATHAANLVLAPVVLLLMVR